MAAPHSPRTPSVDGTTLGPGGKNPGFHDAEKVEHPPGEELEFPHELKRGLKARHITMIAIGGAIGTGLVIGTYVFFFFFSFSFFFVSSLLSSSSSLLLLQMQHLPAVMNE